MSGSNKEGEGQMSLKQKIIKKKAEIKEANRDLAQARANNAVFKDRMTCINRVARLESQLDALIEESGGPQQPLQQQQPQNVPGTGECNTTHQASNVSKQSNNMSDKDAEKKQETLAEKIGRLDGELKVAENARGGWTDPPSERFKHFDKEVTGLRQQLSEATVLLSEANQLIILEKKQASQQQQPQTDALSREEIVEVVKGTIKETVLLQAAADRKKLDADRKKLDADRKKLDADRKTVSTGFSKASQAHNDHVLHAWGLVLLPRTGFQITHEQDQKVASPFEWSASKEDSQVHRFGYMKWLREHIKVSEHDWIDANGEVEVKEGKMTTTASNLPGSFLHLNVEGVYKLSGSTDVGLAHVEFIEAGLASNGLQCIIELKKKVKLLTLPEKNRARCQTVMEHLALGSAKPHIKLVSVLSDLNDVWELFWFEQPNKLVKRLMSREEAIVCLMQLNTKDDVLSFRCSFDQLIRGPPRPLRPVEEGIEPDSGGYSGSDGKGSDEGGDDEGGDDEGGDDGSHAPREAATRRSKSSEMASGPPNSIYEAMLQDDVGNLLSLRNGDFAHDLELHREYVKQRFMPGLLLGF